MDEQLIMDIANGVNDMYKKGIEVGKKLAEKEIELLKEEINILRTKSFKEEQRTRPNLHDLREDQRK